MWLHQSKSNRANLPFLTLLMLHHRYRGPNQLLLMPAARNHRSLIPSTPPRKSPNPSLLHHLPRRLVVECNHQSLIRLILPRRSPRLRRHRRCPHRLVEAHNRRYLTLLMPLRKNPSRSPHRRRRYPNRLMEECNHQSLLPLMLPHRSPNLLHHRRRQRSSQPMEACNRRYLTPLMLLGRNPNRRLLHLRLLVTPLRHLLPSSSIAPRCNKRKKGRPILTYPSLPFGKNGAMT
mmetsp:Transcript_13340/g.38062  ORF Transcript_13340/g.38062 Transcript_13340/m.38062 type:complete len:233 (-) Transcript_13340:3184-3882(-)